MNYDESPVRNRINMTTVVVIGIVLLAIFLLSDGSFDIRSKSLTTQSILSEDGNQTFSRGDDTNSSTQDIPADNDIVAGPNTCEHINFGFPDYFGTNKEGLNCADAIEPERDIECLANPPLQYDGIIDLGSPDRISNPTLTCCEISGLCVW